MGSSITVGSLILCLCVCVCTVLSQQHLLFLPSELSARGQSQVCVVGSGLRGGVDLSLNLLCPKIAAPLLAIHVQRPDAWNCFNFTVPDIPESVCSVQIIGSISVRKINDTKLVYIRPTSDITIIQTDKTSYLPAQTVKFRILTLDSSFNPVKKTYSLIELKNNVGTVLARWQGVDGGRGGIVSLEFLLSSRPVLGRYVLTVGETGGWTERETQQHFTVEEYVLPRFEVDFSSPAQITPLHTTIRLAVCAKYTFAKGVQGTVKLSVCRHHHYTSWTDRIFWKLPPPVCVNITSEPASDGCFTSNVDTSTFFTSDPSLSSSLDVEMEFRERATGEFRKHSQTIRISSQISTLSFVDPPTFYKPGLPLEIKAKLLDSDGSPSGGKEVTLRVFASANVTSVERSVTCHRGIAVFLLNTEAWTFGVQLEARDSRRDVLRQWGQTLVYGADSTNLSPAYSVTGSFVQVRGATEADTCRSQLRLTVEFILRSAGKRRPTFYYLGMSRGQIHFYGTRSVNLFGTKASFPLTLTLSPSMSPRLRILVFTILARGEAVAGATQIQLPPCFQEVSFQMLPPGGLPGSEVGINLRSAPGGICGIRVVDKSVALNDPGQELTAARVFSQLAFPDLTGHRYNLNDHEPITCIDKPDDSHPVLVPDYSSFDLGDAYNAFKELGLKIFTNIDVRRPILCYSRPMPYIGTVHHTHFADFRESFSAVVDLGTQIRTYFPETWLWDLISVGSDGSASYSATVPDQITTWIGNSFCLSDAGFGISDRVEFVAFKDIFVRPSFPRVVVRGETFKLRATVFNYLPSCVQVGVSLELGSGFEERTCDSCSHQVCICSGNDSTVQWDITAQSIGQENITVSAEILKTKGSRCDLDSQTQYKAKDIVIKPILNKAEGKEIEMVTNIYVCVTASERSSGNFSLDLPVNHIPGSESAFLSLTGNLIGSALDNLDNLLSLPRGCGEQNMLALGPNAYITRYLTSTGQLSETLRERAVRFQLAGYQNQLRYLRYDGSYSAFGSRDPSGSIWLTAFVLKVFSAVRGFIFIDRELLVKSARWIEEQQDKDGCFPNVGRVVHSNMMGGIDGPVTLTAYITIALLELELPELAGATSRALDCLRAQHGGVTQAYALALLAYTFGLAREASVVDSLRTRLYAKAIWEGGTVHWETEQAEGGGRSAQVELTAYVLLQLLVGGGGGAIDAPPIIQWLVAQRNKRGGFQSTQDTVIALQGISLYEERSSRGISGDRTFTVGGPRFVRVVEVTEGTEVVRREVQLPSVPGRYWWSLEGLGCVYVQVSLLYNIPAVSTSHSFELNVVLTCQGSNMFEIQIETRYIGTEVQSNMAIVEIELLSGFEITKESQEQLSRSVDNVEFPEGFVRIYFNEIGKKGVDMKLMVEQKYPVTNLESKAIKVYDYYKPEDEADFVYNTPCQKD